MAKIVKKSVIPIYVVAAVWAVWALLLPLYHAAHFVLAAAVSTVAWAVARKVCKDTVLIVPDPKPEPVSTGDPALDALIAERDRALSEMKRMNASIEDPVISAHIDHLETVTGKIISHVVAHPEKQSQIRRFMDVRRSVLHKLNRSADNPADFLIPQPVSFNHQIIAGQPALLQTENTADNRFFQYN